MDEDWEAEVEQRKAKRRAGERQLPRPPEHERFQLPGSVMDNAIVFGIAILVLCAAGIWNTWKDATHQNRSTLPQVVSNEVPLNRSK